MSQRQAVARCRHDWTNLPNLDGGALVVRRLSVMAVALLCLLVVPSGAYAQTLPDCELHVWPTQQYSAVYHSANIGIGAYGPAVVGTTLTPMQEVARRVSLAVDPQAQIDAITALDLGSTPRFQGYEVIFHDAPETSPHLNWVSRDVGQGPRDTSSTSQCYAELHVIFITLFRTAISKKIQTVFLYREFGASPTMTYKAVDAGSTGASDFDTGAEGLTDAAMLSVRAAFTENLRIFLRKRKMRLPDQR